MSRADLPRGRVLLTLLAASTLGCGGIREFAQVEQHQVSEEVRVLLGGGGNTLVLLHGPDALVVDPKFLGYARGLQREVEDRWRRTVRRIVLTHSHADHVKGAALFRSVGAVLVHPEAKETITRSSREACNLPASSQGRRSGFEPTDATPFAQLRRPGTTPLCALPYVEVEGEQALRLGGEEVLLIPLRGHTRGDVAVYLVKHRLLVAGDLVLKGWMPHLDPENGGDPLEMKRALERLLELPFETLVPGHGPLGGRKDVELAREYLRALEEDVRAARAKGASEDQAAAQVALAEQFEGLRPIPGDSHALNVRLMYRAQEQERKQEQERNDP